MVKLTSVEGGLKHEIALRHCILCGKMLDLLHSGGNIPSNVIL